MSVAGQIPDVVYCTVYDIPPIPLVISPDVGSIVAPSLTAGLNVNVPPIVPVIVALFDSPTQKSVRVKLASSSG